MAKKFEKNLTASNKEIKAARARLIAEDAEAACKETIASYEKDLRQLNTRLMNLEDLSPDSTLSLKPISGDFEACKWVAELMDVKRDIKLTQIDLNIAKEIYNEYFGEEPLQL